MSIGEFEKMAVWSFMLSKALQ